MANKVIILSRKGCYDDESEIAGVFSTKKEITKYKKWLKSNYPVLYEDATFYEDEREVDKYYN